MNLDQALQTYIAEGRSLLQDMEDILLELENRPDDAEKIGALFRAVHTIKGSAGVFGLDAIVAFTHVVESMLDKLRDGDIAVSSELIGVALECGDHISLLIDCVADEMQTLDAEQKAQGEQLLKRVRMLMGAEEPGASEGARVPVERPDPVERDPVESAGGGVIELDNWHISVQFGRDVMRSGMDPASFIRYMGSLGDIVNLKTDYAAMPALAEMDAESCYLGFEIGLRSNADKKTIEDVFEFVREDCRLRILPPPSHLAKYVDQIEDLSGNVEKLGEILRQAGILTEAELAEALKAQQQAESDAAGRAPRPLGEILVNEGMVQGEVVNVALEKQRQIREHKQQESKFIRVNAEKLDQLINLVGELVIAGASASLLAQRSGNTGLHEAAAVINRYVEEIREDALRLRMVEIGETFNRFQRVVRDVSKEIGKDIALEISGADTELDKTVVEKIGDPLMHLVRNAMDHGIEPTDIRKAKGKPLKGTVGLHAYHDSGSIVIEVRDDGGGLKREKILAKALERGLIMPGQNLSDREILNLIFEPGFSTAEKVTNLSGRGVGMDVVRSNIEALRGTVDVESHEGVGTTMRIRLPLTLAIIDGFLVGVGANAFVVPLDMVLECLELPEVNRQAERQSDYLNLRGEVLPLVNIRQHFAIDAPAGRRENVVVVKYAGKKAGLVVDKLLGEFQTVIKPLNKMFKRVKCVSGSTILGSGDVALILDVPALVQQASDTEHVSESRSEVLIGA